MSDSLKETLNQAAQLAMEQEHDRKIAQQNLLDSLMNIEGHVGEVWNQLGTCRIGGTYQCDQMAALFFNILPFKTI